MIIWKIRTSQLERDPVLYKSLVSMVIKTSVIYRRQKFAIKLYHQTKIVDAHFEKLKWWFKVFERITVKCISMSIGALIHWVKMLTYRTMEGQTDGQCAFWKVPAKYTVEPSLFWCLISPVFGRYYCSLILSIQFWIVN